MMKPRLAYIIFVSLSYVGCTANAFRDTYTANRTTDQTQAPIKQTVGSLGKINTDSFECRIPPAAKPLLTTLKHQLREVIYNRINYAHIQANPDELRTGILADLKNLGVTYKESEANPSLADQDLVETGYTYGEICTITVEKPEGHRNVLVATTAIGVTCGLDTSLYLFQNRGARWDLALADEASDYDNVSGARWQLQYGISLPDKQNNFFVVAADVTPWCTSFWRQLRFRVLTPGQTAYEPRVLLSEERTIYLGSDLEDGKSYRLKLRGNRFTLQFLGEKFEKWVTSLDPDLDPDDPASLDVVSYKIIGDRMAVLRN